MNMWCFLWSNCELCASGVPDHVSPLRGSCATVGLCVLCPVLRHLWVLCHVFSCLVSCFSSLLGLVSRLVLCLVSCFGLALLLGLVSCLVLCLSGATVGCVLSVSMYPLRCYFWVLCPGLWLPPASSRLLAAAQWRRGRRLKDFQSFS